jgi:hypothetical protein
MSELIKLVGIVDYNKNISFSIMMNINRGGYRYTLNGHRLRYDAPTQDYIDWAQRRFRKVLDYTGNNPRRGVAPIAKSAAKPWFDIEESPSPTSPVLFTVVVQYAQNDHYLYLSASLTVEELKLKIQEKVDVPPNRQSLRLRGAQQLVLTDDLSLVDLKIAEIGFVILMLEEKFDIYIFELPSGKAHVLDVAPSSTVDNIKEMLCSDCAAAKCEMLLIFDGEPLDDEKTVLECHINQKSFVYMVLTFSLLVHRVSEPVFKLQARALNTIADIKQMIQDKVGVPTKDQVICLEDSSNLPGQVLFDNKTLKNYNIGPDHHIWLI